MSEQQIPSLPTLMLLAMSFPSIPNPFSLVGEGRSREQRHA